jgi:phosphopentomutase
MITVDHGNDPTWKGTDHTREKVPCFELHAGRSTILGEMQGFGYVAERVAGNFQIPWSAAGSVENR